MLFMGVPPLDQKIVRRLQRRWLELANDEKLGDHGFKAMHFQADDARL
jgi:hypothetical protein